MVFNELEENVHLEGYERAEDNDMLELAICLDLTASMGPWIERCKKTIISIIDNLVKSVFEKDGLYVRVAFVGYRDFKDKDQFQIVDFTDNVQSVKEYIELDCKASGGDDWPEDVSGGL